MINKKEKKREKPEQFLIKTSVGKTKDKLYINSLYKYDIISLYD